jgi:hypothetical protein
VVGKKNGVVEDELAMDANLVVAVLDLGKGGLGHANRIAREEAAGEKFRITESTALIPIVRVPTWLGSRSGQLSRNCGK